MVPLQGWGLPYGLIYWMINILIVGQMPSKKPGSWTPMGAMVRTLVGLLCLLLAPAGASQDGELCLGWLPSHITGFPPFRCPQRPDGTDGPFCCGTCNEPYCCNSKEDRQDPDECLHVWRLLHFSVRAMLARRAKATTLPTSDPQTQRVTSVWSFWKKELTGGDIGGIASLVIAFIILLALLLCEYSPCMKNYQIWRRATRHGVYTLPPTPPETNYYHYTPPPSKETSGAPLDDLEEPLSIRYTASPAMDRATVRPRPRPQPRRPPTPPVCGPEEAATQVPPTIWATSDAAAAGVVTPELGAVGGGETMVSWDIAGGGEAMASWDAACGREVVSHVVSSAAPGLISTQLVPMKRTMSGSSRDSWEIKETEV